MEPGPMAALEYSSSATVNQLHCFSSVKITQVLNAHTMLQKTQAHYSAQVVNNNKNLRTELTFKRLVYIRGIFLEYKDYASRADRDVQFGHSRTFFLG